jgi:Xaa-Pro aminopeptidase
MLSMEPSIKRGLTFWDRALMPADEFDERLRLVREEMRRMGLAALVIAGNMYEDAELVYLVSYNVDGTLVLPLEGEPAIFTNSGSREGYFLKTLTWIEDLSHRGPLVGKAVADKLRERGVTKGRVGTAGLQVLASRPYHDLVDALAGYDLVDFAPALAAIRGRVRPRELAAVEVALGIAQRAAAAADRAFAAGASNAAAVVEAERVARLAGAWDFRALANLDGGWLRPFEHASDARRAPLLLWLAARYQGYWADCATASAAPAVSEAAKAVRAMTEAAKSGAAVAAVAEAVAQSAQ